MSFASYLKEQAKQNEKPDYRFKTFNPYQESDYYHGNYTISATTALNKWLEENPRVEIISWQTTPVGTTNELYITIQYREREKD
jgi:hypothetical protein